MTLTADDVSAIVAGVVAALRAEAPPAPAPLVQPVDKTLRIEEVREMLRCRSVSGTYATLKALGVRPYIRGRWLWHDIHNAQAKASFRARGAGKRSQEPGVRSQEKAQGKAARATAEDLS